MNPLDDNVTVPSTPNGSTHHSVGGELARNGRMCTVCDGVASGMYFGSLVCLPCKSFFIRSTKDGEPHFTCATNQGNCDILLGNRLRCQFCRYQKCLQVGMCRKEKPEVVDAQEGQKLCDVCHDIANGIHFGVPTCEGCKKFYRRGMKEADTYECKLNKACPINPRNRNMCRYCRYQRCLTVGMSKQAIQMGRPKKDTLQGKRLLHSETNKSPRAEGLPEAANLCRVCSEPAGGINFGVPTCKDCEVFFRYASGEGERLKCNYGQKCNIDSQNKSACHFCRYQRCLVAGMSPISVQQMVHPLSMIMADSTAHHPKRYRSEDSVTDISRTESCNTKPTVSDFPFQSVPMDTDHLLQNGKQSVIIPDSRHCTHSQEKPMELPMSMQKIESDFDNIDLNLLCRNTNNLCPQDESTGTRSSFTLPNQQNGAEKTDSTNNSFATMDIDSFIDLLGKDSCDLSSGDLDKWHHQSDVESHARATERVLGKEEGIGYINENKLHIVNKFYDKIQNQTDVDTYQETADTCKSDRLQSGTAPDTSVDKEAFAIKEEPQGSGEDYEFTNTIFSSNMKHSHPDSGKIDSMLSQDLDPGKKVILEKQKAKLSLFSRYYWKLPLKLHGLVINSSRTVLIIARIIKAYKIFLNCTDEGQEGKFTLNQKTHWPQEKPKDFPFWELIKNRIMKNTRYCIDFIRSSVTEVMHLNPDDAKVLFFYGSFQAMIILSTRERYNPEEKTFHYFWNWKVPPQSPAHLFRENLLKTAEDLHNMNLDITESAIMCVLSVVSADWIILREPELVEKLRSPIISAFQEYLSVKYGWQSQRGEDLLGMMPVLRELTLWHSEMLANMKLSIKTEEMDGLFESLCV